MFLTYFVNYHFVFCQVRDDTVDISQDAAANNNNNNADIYDPASKIVGDRFLEFLNSFDDGSGPGSYSYINQIAALTLRPGGSTLFVDYSHLSSYDYELSEALSLEYYRFSHSLTKALSTFIKTHAPDYHSQAVKDRMHLAVSLYNLPEVLAVRALRTERVGHVVSVVGTVTRSSDVRPEVRKNPFTCSKLRSCAP